MINKRTYGRKTIPLFGSIAIVLILISAATAVPQQTSSVVVDQIDKKEQLNTLMETINSEEITEQGMLTIASFILNLANSLIRDVQQNPKNVELTEEKILNAVSDTSEDATVDQVISQTETTLNELQETVESLKESNNAASQSIDISSLENIITLLVTFLQDNLLSGDINIGGNSNGGLLSKIGNVFGVILSVITFILKGIVQAVSLLLGGILKVVTALVSIVLLILAGIQTTLTIGAFFLIFLGFVSKIGLSIFSILGAPVFAILAAQFTISAGKLLGGLTMGLLSLLALLVFFALPIIAIGLIWSLTGDSNNDDEGSDNNIDINFNFDAEGPVYMLISVFLYMLK
jgi:hypothetical protein